MGNKKKKTINDCLRQVGVDLKEGMLCISEASVLDILNGSLLVLFAYFPTAYCHSALQCMFKKNKNKHEDDEKPPCFASVFRKIVL